MRGSPLLRAALMVAALLLLIIPLRSFTASRTAAPAPPAAAPAAPVKVHLQLTATATPVTFEVSHLGAVIWRGEAPATPVDTDVILEFPAEGIDLALDAKWPSGQTAAVRLAVGREGGETVAQTLWGEGAVNDVLTFK